MAYAFAIAPDTRVRLREFDASHNGGLSKAEGIARFDKLDARLDQLQEELYAAGSQSVLAIFQGMDTAGKDGAIRSVFRSCNPQGMRVESFKVPSEEELAHDFLWRVHAATPRRGMLGVFNRSHYEDVLVVRVHSLVPETIWRARYDQINDFERLLAASGTIVLKFFLHISKEEQEQRLREREQDVTKAWKLSAGDWRERERWDAYQEAYEEALSRCSTSHAPWHLIPANRKWYRNLAIAEVIVDALEEHRKGWTKRLEKLSTERLSELEAYRASIGKAP
jgi:PPK2 family polyphosphate:nucleotide phosphotransferase